MIIYPGLYIYYLIQITYEIRQLFYIYIVISCPLVYESPKLYLTITDQLLINYRSIITDQNEKWKRKEWERKGGERDLSTSSSYKNKGTYHCSVADSDPEDPGLFGSGSGSLKSKTWTKNY